MGNNKWAYKLYGPLNMLGAFSYRYCRNAQCGSADDAATAGSSAAGRSAITNLSSQDLQDTVSAWNWYDNPEPTTLVGAGITPRQGFTAGIDLQADYRPNWSYYMPQALTNIQALGANQVVFSPTWTFSLANPLKFDPVPGRDALWPDLTTSINQARALGLNAAIFPAAHFNAAPADFWKAAPRDAAWWQTPALAGGQRLIEFRVYTECGEVAIRYAYLPVYPPPDAGIDGDTLLCAGSPPVDLKTVLKGNPGPGGTWSPKTAAGNGLFDPEKDPPGVYAYVLPPFGDCPGDTAFVTIAVEKGLELGKDTTLCYDDALVLEVPPGLTDWQWNDGSHRQKTTVTTPGTFTLTGQTAHCTFTDSVRVDFFTCRECPFYAPNVFSPNDDGDNDEWHIYLPCAWQSFHLAVFDRWGSLVFRSDDPEEGWDGFVRGRAPVPGVYVWRLEWTGELFGQPKTYREEGDVTVLR